MVENEQHNPRPLLSAVTVKFFGISNLISSGLVLTPASPGLGIGAAVALGEKQQN